MSFELTYSRSIRMQVHLDKDKAIVGLEVPKAVLDGISVEYKSMPVESTTCSKGLIECVREVLSVEVPVQLHVIYDNATYYSNKKGTLRDVTISDTSLQRIIEDLEEESANKFCPEFDPIHVSYAGLDQCTYCSLLGVCPRGVVAGMEE